MLYPSLSHTYYHAFKLYTKSYIDVFWFLLLLALSQIGINKFFPEVTSVDARFFSRIFLDMCLTALFFSFIICAQYQKYTSKKSNIFTAIKQGMHGYIDVVIAYFLISLPLLLTLYLQMKIKIPFLSPIMQQLPMILVLIITIIIVTYSFVAAIVIFTEQRNGIASLLKSGRLVHPYWVDTLLVVLMYGIMATALSLLLQAAQFPYYSVIFTMLASSFYPALMIVHFESLKNVKKDLSAK